MQTQRKAEAAEKKQETETPFVVGFFGVKVASVNSCLTASVPTRSAPCTTEIILPASYIFLHKYYVDRGRTCRARTRAKIKQNAPFNTMDTQKEP
uniref:Uncharacterized protein n=1 Tax=Oryza brachyantha TaxID=4533 RepID=J3LKZ9_ORYBR